MELGSPLWKLQCGCSSKPPPGGALVFLLEQRELQNSVTPPVIPGVSVKGWEPESQIGTETGWTGSCPLGETDGESPDEKSRLGNVPDEMESDGTLCCEHEGPGVLEGRVETEGARRRKSSSPQNQPP